jgi:putative transposase
MQYPLDQPLEGYRRLTYMMLDSDVVGCSHSSVYQVLKGAAITDRGSDPDRVGSEI